MSKSTKEALHEAQHAANQAVRKASQDPIKVEAAAKYFAALDDSHRAAFLHANPFMQNAMVLAGKLSNTEINRLSEGSAYQTTDGKPLDPTVVEQPFIG